MYRQLRAPLGALLVIAAGAVPAGAQTAGVFQQGLRNNPFTPLLRDRAVFSNHLSVQGDNNTLNFGDIVAIYRIADDEFLPSDAFLIGGLIPEGEGAMYRSHDDAFTLLGIPLPFGMIGLTAGARAHVDGFVPEGLTRFLRDGATGETFTVDMEGFFTRAVVYADLGAVALFDVMRDDAAQRRIRLGVGAHYLTMGRSIDVLFQNPAGTRFSRFTSSRDLIQADLVGTYPLGFEDSGGSGMAFDGFVGANLGSKLYVSGMVRGVGSIDAATQERVVMDTTLAADGIGDFFDQVDGLGDVAWQDTIPSGTESISLPAMVQVEASYQLTDRFGIGGSFEGGFGGDFEVSPLVRGVVELRPLRWLPLRLGASQRSEFGMGFEGGFGLDFSHFAFELEGGTRGSMAIDETESFNLRAGFAVLF